MASAAARRLPQHLKELRIHLCQRSPASQGVREWVETSYVDLKKANPKFPILIRECSGVQPKIYARYEYGRETSASLENVTSQQVADTLGTMADTPTSQ
ncbi:NADH dehydrogenase [ubiquinone] 1 alpha subcomplex subunit 2-like [Asterias rubens]|uniref:NADH dehydrogenase [ubiquinone] 1 alpha subcomplex subunit 2-like n=1 Tax=Asterias rubens TaxID=7604 RepID=UPI0014555911|nr:NADH dehydrogenase [ubiquinone] 1 alpha subcomplex subunit 2-like [Asterias rubens]